MPGFKKAKHSSSEKAINYSFDIYEKDDACLDRLQAYRIVYAQMDIIDIYI